MRKMKKKIAEALELPLAAFGRCPGIAIEGNHAVRIDECVEILTYDEEETVLLVRGMTVTVRGRELTMRSYGGGTIRLTGIVSGVLLSDGQ